MNYLPRYPSLMRRYWRSLQKVDRRLPAARTKITQLHFATLQDDDSTYRSPSSSSSSTTSSSSSSMPDCDHSRCTSGEQKLEQDFNKRLEICGKCQHAKMDPIVGVVEFCEKCGCKITFKAFFESLHCPIGKVCFPQKYFGAHELQLIEPNDIKNSSGNHGDLFS